MVTGASTGIGFNLTKTLLDKGYRVVMNANNQERLDKAFADLGSPEDAISVQGDIGKIETGKKLVAAAVKSFGRVDALINNAGVFEPRPFLEVDEEHLDKFLSIGLKGTYFATQAVIPELKKQGGGHVINIGTTLLDHALGGVHITAPMAAKGAIRAVSVQLAAEFSKDNIRVNSVAPGIIRTPMHVKEGEDTADSMAGLHLLGRVGETEDISSAILYLLESDFVTGIELRVDGGHAAGHNLS
ncbi:MAG: SDR family oxidoreductase [Proteobacteria bacterium]|nr:SDR family oxidoreductase [Pseudomonadota bacterium]